MREEMEEDYELDDVQDHSGSNFKVVLRVRPPVPRELQGDRRFQNIARCENDNRITVSENIVALDDPEQTGNYSSYTFTFDHVYSEDSDQASVYLNTARDAVLSSLSGYNATIIAYGQTGTGKTYTMEGEAEPRCRGIIPRATEEIFSYIENAVSERKKFLVRASYLQIYNECISDLLKPERTNLQVREDKRRGVFVEGLSEWVVRSPKEVYGLMQRGASTRSTATTKMNEISSRSHAVFIIIAEQLEYLEGEEQEGHAFKVGKLNLVDLAGSERVRLTGATGRRLEESKKINQSLSALGNVIAALTDTKQRQHIPYRDSKLTRILEDSLGGNCKTTMMAMISPALESFPESLSTLKFANRAKTIKNLARVNEDLDQRGLLRRYEQEIKTLRNQLANKSQEIVDKRKVLQLEELRRRAEADKSAALTALEERSREFMREKAEKKKLEQRLHSMSSQLLIGGSQGVESTPAFRTALRTEHEKIHSEYVKKMEELERERHVLSEDKSQVDRYKQLLLKQRDIMIALTARLNERDEMIMRLQEEVDAYDRHQRDLEDLVDQKTAGLIHLQRVAMEQADSPQKKAELAQAFAQQEFGSNSPEDADATDVFSASEHKGSEALGDLGALDIGLGIGGDVQREVLETYLQEKLEQMVQDEIHERLEHFRNEVLARPEGDSQQLLQMREEQAALRRLVQDLKAKADDAEARCRRAEKEQGEAGRLRQQLAAVQEQCEQLRREAAARGGDGQAVAELERQLRAARAAGPAHSEACRPGCDHERRAERHEEELREAHRLSEEQKGKIDVLKQYCAMNNKERAALRTIMEIKIKGLVDAALETAGDAQSEPLLRDRLVALRKIVNASVLAMKADNGQQGGVLGVQALEDRR